MQAIYAAMLGRPNVSAGWLAEKNGVTPATVNNALVHLESLGIVQQLGENKRNRPIAYRQSMEILSEAGQGLFLNNSFVQLAASKGNFLLP